MAKYVKDQVKKAKVSLPRIVQSEHGDFNITYATNQSYVHLNKQFLVAINQKQSGGGNKHHQLMYKLVKEVAAKPHCSKEVALQCRDALLGD